MEYELRILSGLHRGACLPLSLGGRLTVGSDADCDVVLVDPGMQPVEFSLQLEPQGWLIERFDRKGRPGEAVCLPWDRPMAFGGVALTVSDSAQAWAFVSADEVAAAAAHAAPPATASKKGDAAVPAWAGGDSGGRGGGFGRFKASRKVTQRLIVMGAVMLGFATFSISRTVTPAQEAQQPESRIPWGGRSGGTGAAAALDDTQPTFPRGKPVLPDIDPLDAVVARVMAEDKAQSAAQRGAGASAAPAAANKAPPPGPAQLRALMVQRLKDAYLADKLELDLTDAAWNMRGALDEEDSRLFGRILASFYKEHDVKVPLHAYVNSAEEMLPFKIQQFSGGALASVVTGDGQRLYVGDSHKGYTLQRIDGRRILFAGKRKVEVIW